MNKCIIDKGEQAGLRTSSYFLVLLCTSWYFSVPRRTSLYFSVLPGTSRYFSVLLFPKTKQRSSVITQYQKLYFEKLEHLCSVIGDQIFDTAQ